MSEETWNKYCQKLEELRRLQDDTRKRRNESAAVEIIDKSLRVVESVIVTNAFSTVGIDKNGSSAAGA